MSLNNLTDKQSLLPLMGKLIKELNAIFIKELSAARINLTKEQAIVLNKLLEKDGRPQSDLALVTSRDKTSLTRLLTSMEKKNLIVRSQSQMDKRVNHIHITDKGRNEIHKAMPVMLHIMDIAVHNLDQDKIDSTKALIMDIYKNFNLEPYE